MNYIQQNARDLVVGLREMKWKAFEQQLLTPPDEDNFDCARPSDFGDDVPEAGLWGMPTWVLDEQRRLEQQKKAIPIPRLFAGEDTSHLPQQIRQQITFITGEFNV